MYCRFICIPEALPSCNVWEVISINNIIIVFKIVLLCCRFHNYDYYQSMGVVRGVGNFMMEVARCVGLIRGIIQEKAQYHDVRNFPQDTLDFFLLCIELAYRELLVLDITGHLTQSQGEALEMVCWYFVIIKELEQLGHRQLQESSAPIDSVTLVHTGAVGRPRYDIPDHSLELLLEKRFTVPQMSSLFGVSMSTIRRRMTILGLFVRSYYPTMPETELDAIVMDIQHQYPMCGNRQMQGHLLLRGYRIQQSRIRESQRRIDPSETAL